MIKAHLQKAEPIHLLHALDWVKTEEDLLLWAGRGLPFPAKSADWMASLAKPDLIPFAFLSFDQILIGYLELNRIDLISKSGYLSRVIVNPDFRERGYGAAMVKELIVCAEEFIGLEQLLLNVFDENQRAIDLYTGFGFIKMDNSQFHVLGKTFEKNGFRMLRQKTAPENRPTRAI